MNSVTRHTVILLTAMILGGTAQFAYASGSHDGQHGAKGMMDQMRQQHSLHEHGHDFEAVEEMSPQRMERMVALMQDVGLVVPRMDAVRGRKLFVETGCVVCHVVNNVGGDIGPSLNAADLPTPMNAFEFAARMWRGAAAMTAMQQNMLGEVIPLTGQDLADLIAFAHDAHEQEKLTESQIPEKFHGLIEE